MAVYLITVMSNSLQLHGLIACQAPLSMGILDRREYWKWVGHFFFQGIFLTQGLNPGPLLCRWILYCLRHERRPRVLEQVAYLFSRGSSLSPGELPNQEIEPRSDSLPAELPGKPSLVGYSPWGHKELDTTGATEHACTIYRYSRRQFTPERRNTESGRSNEIQQQ